MKEIKDIDKYRDQFIIWTLRRASFRWPPRGEAMKLARVDRGLYRCAGCNSTFKNKEVRVDHVKPVVPLPSELSSMRKEAGDIREYTKADMGQIMRRMFPEASGFQILCVNCHSDKTRREQDERKEYRAIQRKSRNKR